MDHGRSPWFLAQGRSGHWRVFAARPFEANELVEVREASGRGAWLYPHGFQWKYSGWLVVWNIFPFSWEWKIIPTDFNSMIFQMGRSTTNQDRMGILMGYDMLGCRWGFHGIPRYIFG